MSWSASDNFFVNSKLEVFTVDLFSESLELTQSKEVIYDGPKGDDFKRFLRSKNLRVNRQGKAIIRVEKRDDNGEFLEGQYETFILERMFPLDHYGFRNVPLPKPQAVNELQCLLDNTNAELAKKDDALNKLQCCLNDTKAELAEKNDVFDHLMKWRKTNGQDWNSEQFQLIMTTIANSMKRVFVNFGLEPPASGDPKSVLTFLEMLHGVIIHQELGATFLVAANEILASIESMFEKRTGLSIGMETTTNSSTVSTPTVLIRNLFTLRSFLVDSHFFIDGSTIVKRFCLINEDDISVIFRDSATNVGELKQKEVGAKSIDNIDKKSIFYGYFNIPMVGMFKGVLTRVHVNMPDDIMVKLGAGGKQSLIDDKRFWFVSANGSGIFRKEEALNPSELTNNLRYAKFAPSRVLGDSSNIFEFLRRMNGTYVNSKGRYIKYEFSATKSSGPWVSSDNSVYFVESSQQMIDPFSFVQFDWNKPAMDIQQRPFVLPKIPKNHIPTNLEWYPSGVGPSFATAFRFREFCFIGTVSRVSDTFYDNALVNVFFEQTKYDKDNCYVDALATSFVVFKTKDVQLSKASETQIPRFI